MKNQLPWQIVEASFEAAAQAADQLPPQLSVELAFAGRSNVGKSSLLNALLDRKRLVRTSSTPGCTRQINFFKARARDGAQLCMVDLPGYGYAKRAKTERADWGRLIESYLVERDHLRAVVLLIDARRGLGELDRRLIELLAAREPRPLPAVIVVATKIDRVAKSKRRAALAKLALPDHGTVLGVSATTGEGIDALWRALRKVALEE